MRMLLHADASALSLRGRRTTQDTTPGSRTPRSLLFPELGESVPRTTADSNFQANPGGASRFPPGSPGAPASPAHSEPKFIPLAGPGSARPVRRARRAPERVTPSRSRSRPVGGPPLPPPAAGRTPLARRNTRPGRHLTCRPQAAMARKRRQEARRRKRTLSGPPRQPSPDKRFRPRRPTLPPSPRQARARGRRVPPRPFPGAVAGAGAALLFRRPGLSAGASHAQPLRTHPRRTAAGSLGRPETSAGSGAPSRPRPRPRAPESDTARVPATGPAPELLAWHKHRVQERVLVFVVFRSNFLLKALSCLHLKIMLNRKPVGAPPPPAGVGHEPRGRGAGLTPQRTAPSASRPLSRSRAWTRGTFARHFPPAVSPQRTLWKRQTACCHGGGG